MGRLLDLYRAEGLEVETVEGFGERVGLARIREAIKHLTEPPPRAEAPDAWSDWGGTEAWGAHSGPAECAS